MNALFALLLTLSFWQANYLPTVHPVVTEARAEWVEIGEVRITGYGCYGVEPCRNAIGRHPEIGDVGVPLSGPLALPMGTELEIDDERYVVRDTCPGCGSDMWLDRYFERYEEEIEWGSKVRKVKVRK